MQPKFQGPVDLQFCPPASRHLLIATDSASEADVRSPEYPAATRDLPLTLQTPPATAFHSFGAGGGGAGGIARFAMVFPSDVSLRTLSAVRYCDAGRPLSAPYLLR